MPWDEIRQRVIFSMRIIQPQGIIIEHMYTKKKKKGKRCQNCCSPKVVSKRRKGSGAPYLDGFGHLIGQVAGSDGFNVAVLYRGTFTLSFKIDKLGHAMGHAIC